MLHLPRRLSLRLCRSSPELRLTLILTLTESRKRQGGELNLMLQPNSLEREIQPLRLEADFLIANDPPSLLGVTGCHLFCERELS